LKKIVEQFKGYKPELNEIADLKIVEFNNKNTSKSPTISFVSSGNMEFLDIISIRF